MKYLKIAFGLALTASLMAVSAAPTLAAGPVWEQCREHAGTGTKWEDNKCSKSNFLGNWEWKEITATEKVTGQGTLRMIDTKVPIVGSVEVICSSTGSGPLGPGKFGKTEEFKGISCVAGKNCEKVEKIVSPIHLPWQSELYETEKTVRALGTGGGGGVPGWTVECRVLGISKGDECTSEVQTSLMENVQASGSVKAIFDTKSGKSECKLGGPKSGELEGTILIHSEAGSAIRVS